MARGWTVPCSRVAQDTLDTCGCPPASWFWLWWFSGISALCQDLSGTVLNIFVWRKGKGELARPQRMSLREWPARETLLQRCSSRLCIQNDLSARGRSRYPWDTPGPSLMEMSVVVASVTPTQVRDVWEEPPSCPPTYAMPVAHLHRGGTLSCPYHGKRTLQTSRKEFS